MLKQSILWLPSLLFVAWVFLAAPDKLAANLGWVYLARAATAEEIQPAFAQNAMNLFAAGASPMAKRAWFGYGAAAAVAGDEAGALQGWTRAHPPSVVLESLGNQYVSRGQWETALIYYLGDAHLSRQSPWQSSRLGNFCQRLRAETATYLGEHAQYCDQYWAQNDNNLLINSNFDDIRGWSTIPTPTVAQVQFQQNEPGDNGHRTLTLTTTAEYAGDFKLCQNVDLFPGEVVKFSMKVAVIDLAQGSDLRLLYIGWRSREGRSNGNGIRLEHAVALQQFERTFELPGDAQNNVLFCPINIVGRAAVQLTEVRLESMDAPR